MISLPPINDITVNKLNRFSITWIKWFQAVYRAITGGEPFPLATYAVLTMPPAINFTGCLIYVSNAAGGAIPAFSDGTNWRRVDTRAIVT